MSTDTAPSGPASRPRGWPLRRSRVPRTVTVPTYRGLAATAGALILGAGVVACGAGPAPLRPRPTPPAAHPAASRTIPEHQTRAVGWPDGHTLTATLGTGGRAVALTLTRGACETLRARRTAGTARAVRVLVVDTDTSHGQPCTLQAVEQTLRVPLRHPLADRTLVLTYRHETA